MRKNISTNKATNRFIRLRRTRADFNDQVMGGAGPPNCHALVQTQIEVDIYRMSKKAIVIAVGLTILLLFVLASFVTPSIGTG